MNFQLRPPAAALVAILAFCISSPVKAQNPATISGRVIRYDFNPETGLWRDRGPIPGIEITLHGQQELITTTTDSNGSYRFPGLVPGTYTVACSPTDSFLITGPMTRTVELQSGQIPSTNFTLRTNGRVNGKVLSDRGAPLAGIVVNLLAFEYRNSSEPHPMKAVSRDNGAYSFEGVPEGRYLLGIRLDGSSQGGTSYPRTYYGATDEPDTASVLTLSEGQRLENIDLALPAPLPKRIIAGVARFPGGGAAKAWIALKPTEYPYDSAGQEIPCDEQGRFAQTAAAGTRFSAMAAGIMPDGNLARSEIVQVSALGNADLSLDLLPANKPRNLLLNGDARDGVAYWTISGTAYVENAAGCDSCFSVRDGGTFSQVVPLPQGSEGQYAVLLGRASSERINPDGAITGLPSLYGLMGTETRVTAYLQGQNMLGRENEPDKWGPVYGVFRIPPGTNRIYFTLHQGERQGLPHNGSAARFDDLGVYILPTELEAKLFVRQRFGSATK
jgi:hypothetical protein